MFCRPVRVTSTDGVFVDALIISTNMRVLQRKIGLDFQIFVDIFTGMIMGRPPKAPEDRRDEDIKIPLTPAEKQAIWDAAEKDAARPITWCRDNLLRIARRKRARK
jgi:hypothetical protein